MARQVRILKLTDGRIAVHDRPDGDYSTLPEGVEAGSVVHAATVDTEFLDGVKDVQRQVSFDGAGAVTKDMEAQTGREERAATRFAALTTLAGLAADENLGTAKPYLEALRDVLFPGGLPTE